MTTEATTRPRKGPNAGTARVLARTAARKAEGLIPVYAEHVPGVDRSALAAGSPPAGGCGSAARALDVIPCANRGDLAGEVTCPTCRGGGIRLKVYACAAHPAGCTLGRKVAGLACCAGERGRPCPDRKIPDQAEPIPPTTPTPDPGAGATDQAPP